MPFIFNTLQLRTYTKKGGWYYPPDPLFFDAQCNLKNTLLNVIEGQPDLAFGGAASVAGEEQQTALRRVEPHGKRRLVLGRVVPGLGGLFVWEFDDDP